VQCEVWSVEGRTRSGQVFLRTIGHLCLGNFRRRLARVYVNNMFSYWITLQQWLSHHSLRHWSSAAVLVVPAASRAHVIPKIKGTGCEALPRWMEGTQDVLRGVGPRDDPEWWRFHLLNNEPTEPTKRRRFDTFCCFVLVDPFMKVKRGQTQRWGEMGFWPIFLNKNRNKKCLNTSQQLQ